MTPETSSQLPAPCLQYFEGLSATANRILLLDYDGTIAPFHVDPAKAVPYAPIPDLLKRIMETGTRVVLITGRPARQLPGLCGIHPQPEIWGSHGFERLRPDGKYEVASLTAQHRKGLELASNALDFANLKMRMEIKPGGVALHWRGMSEIESQVYGEIARTSWTPLTEEYGLKLLDFDAGLEIRAGGITKGDAVQSILEECGRDASPAYLGDDATDEDAFRKLKGKGLSVLVREEFRPTNADIWLKPPEGLIAFLAEWIRASGEQR